ncbi:MAG: M20/M25/M40 family metallo-hydrolase [Herpetosiphonaceae bacterium]|nr:M20/M25/M40 family metallo-hydrolase [Herpetosiphonaceae bacterium]
MILQLDLLKQLLATPSPSGDEAATATLWREYATTFADEVHADVRGNSVAILNGGSLRILLDGHIDEIGLMVTYISEGGFLYIAPIGGWDNQVLVGQRVVVQGRNGVVRGVIGKTPIHLLKGEARDHVTKVEELWIDIGASDKAEAQSLVRVGATAVIDTPVLELPHGRLAARGLDNRIGAFVVIEALRALAQERPHATVAASASVHEEIGGAGARAAAWNFNPQIALVVDVTFTTDDPSGDKQQWGEVSLGSGAVLSRGAANSPVLFDMLCEHAERAAIPYTVQVTAAYTGTNADVIHHSRSGVATAIISIPNRYMHSPSEMIQISDVEHTVQLIAAFVRSLPDEPDLIPH